MIGVVGIAPEKYWCYTLRECALLAHNYEHNQETEWMRTRNIEFSNYNTSFSMNGKRVFREIKKPKDLYELPSEEIKINKNVVIDKEKIIKEVESSKLFTDGK